MFPFSFQVDSLVSNVSEIYDFQTNFLENLEVRPANSNFRHVFSSLFCFHYFSIYPFFSYFVLAELEALFRTRKTTATGAPS